MGCDEGCIIIIVIIIIITCCVKEYGIVEQAEGGFSIFI